MICSVVIVSGTLIDLVAGLVPCPVVPATQLPITPQAASCQAVSQSWVEAEDGKSDRLWLFAL
jgi:hypothetical protein